jgi:hypothetical protein
VVFGAEAEGVEVEWKVECEVEEMCERKRDESRTGRFYEMGEMEKLTLNDVMIAPRRIVDDA